MFYRVGMVVAAGLAELGVKPASALATDLAGHDGAGRWLPVLPALRDLMPDGLRRGSTVAITARGEGATSLLLAVLAEPSRQGAWCAVIGMPTLSLAAAGSIGIALHRLALVPQPGPDAAAIAATLLDGFDVVALATPGSLAASVRAHLAARARQGGSALVTMMAWPGATVTLTAEGGTWVGRRRLRCRRLTVAAGGRGAADRLRRSEMWLPEDPTLQATLSIAGADEPSGQRRLQVVR